MVSIEKRITLADRFFSEKLKLFQRLIASLFCLDKFEKFASQLYLRTL